LAAPDQRTITGAIESTRSPVISVSVRRLAQRVATYGAGMQLAQAGGHELSNEIGC
jgi:hypothetical protein